MRWSVVVLAACSFEHGRAPADAQHDAPPIVPDTPPGVWSAPVEIVELTSGFGEDDPSLTDDLLEIYFGSRRTGSIGAEDIWMASRASPADPWGTPTNV